jgi:hypothetical protein
MTRLLLRGLTAFAAAVAALACIVAAIGFFAAALYLWLRSLPLPSALAALIAGLALLAAAAPLIFAAARVSAGRRRTGGRHPSIADLGDRALHEAAAAAELHPYGAAALALLAGLAIGASADLQEMLKAATGAR